MCAEKRTPVLMKMSNRLNQNGRSFGLECPFVFGERILWIQIARTFVGKSGRLI